VKSLARDLLGGSKHRVPGVIVLLGLLGAAGFAVLDRLLPVTANFAALYLATVLFVAWGAGARAAALLSVVCAGLMAVHEWELAPRTPELPALLAWNLISRAAIFYLAGWLVATAIDLTRELKGSIDQRTAQYQAMLWTAMDGFASVDAAGRFLEANEGFCRILGYEREELVATDLRRIEVKESPEELREHLARIFSRGSDRFETRLRHKDGGAIEVEVSVAVLPGSNGVLIAFVRQIGERKRAEARLRESEERYRTLAESSPDAILIVDRQGLIQYANPAAGALWGSRPESLLGVAQETLFCGEAASQHLTAAARVFETGEPVRIDESLLVPSGNRWIEARLVPVCAPSGKVHSLIVIAVDISERKRTEALLAAQRDLALRLSLTTDLQPALDALLEFAINLEGVDCGGVYLADRQTGALDLAASKGPLSPEFLARVAHYPASADRAELVRKGSPVYDVYSGLPLDTAVDGAELRAIAVLPLRYEGLVVGCLNLGSHTQDVIPLRSRIVMEALAAQTAGAIARIRAESDQRRLEKQILEITDREQARIGQELHDGLCQQLVGLAFDANALQSALTAAKVPEGEVAARIAQYLDQAISETRQLSRGLFPVRLEAEGLPSALEELARATEVRFGVKCVVDCEEHLPIRNATTAVHLYRIAQEAVNNALKHGRSKNIRLQMRAANGELKLEVVDDGVGLSSGTPQSGGMGLHIMGYRARSIGGTLQLSRPVQGGTAVCCCIPGLKPERIPA